MLAEPRSKATCPPGIHHHPFDQNPPDPLGQARDCAHCQPGGVALFILVRQWLPHVNVIPAIDKPRRHPIITDCNGQPSEVSTCESYRPNYFPSSEPPRRLVLDTIPFARPHTPAKFQRSASENASWWIRSCCDRCVGRSRPLARWRICQTSEIIGSRQCFRAAPAQVRQRRSLGNMQAVVGLGWPPV